MSFELCISFCCCFGNVILIESNIFDTTCSTTFGDVVDFIVGSLVSSGDDVVAVDVVERRQLRQVELSVSGDVLQEQAVGLEAFGVCDLRERGAPRRASRSALGCGRALRVLRA